MDLSSWLWIALFIAFILGWFLSRYDVKSLKQNNNKLSYQYFQGLQHLLNEQPDKAIDSFIEVAQLDPETVDLHFALGQMFRKRGEFNRSIRIHESLSNRGLDNESREKALIALGEDYYKAGMFDRAENMFEPFINHPLYHNIAIKYLLIMAKLQQDWLKSVELSNYLDENKEKQIFHLKLQYVEELINQKKYNEALTYLESIDNKQHIRYNLVLSDILFKTNHYDDGLNNLKKLLSINNNSLDFVLDFMHKNKIPITDDLFEYINNDNITANYFKIKFNDLKQKISNDNDNINIQKMHDLVNLELDKYPTTESLKHYAQYLMLENPDRSKSLFLNKTIEILNQSIHNKYICHECGFRAKEFSWACHGCGEWESLEPINS